ncbi:hypothetical protein ACS0TY_030964 [Phlomoides rotata]
MDKEYSLFKWKRRSNWPCTPANYCEIESPLCIWMIVCTHEQEVLDADSKDETHE